MREVVACVVAAALLAGCGHTTRYTTTPAAVQEARLTDRPALPATRDGEPVWIATDRIASEETLSDGTVVLEARDPRRGLQIGGWALLAGGLGIASTGLLIAALRPRRDSLDVADAAAIAAFGAMGGPFVLGGAGLLVAGYLTDGPELPPPPTAHAHGPAR